MSLPECEMPHMKGMHWRSIVPTPRGKQPGFDGRTLPSSETAKKALPLAVRSTVSMGSFYLSGATAVRHSVLRLSLLAAAGLTLLAPGTGRAADLPAYQSSAVVTSGDRLGDLQIPSHDDLFVGGLNDAG